MPPRGGWPRLGKGGGGARLFVFRRAMLIGGRGQILLFFLAGPLSISECASGATRSLGSRGGVWYEYEYTSARSPVLQVEGGHHQWRVTVRICFWQGVSLFFFRASLPRGGTALADRGAHPRLLYNGNSTRSPFFINSRVACSWELQLPQSYVESMTECQVLRIPYE